LAHFLTWIIGPAEKAQGQFYFINDNIRLKICVHNSSKPSNTIFGAFSSYYESTVEV